MDKALGDYTIVKQLGEGSLGAVFSAEHRFLKRPFALKVLPEELASDLDFIHRFEREVASLATLDHPNIVKIHNVSYADGRYFLVTDCIFDGTVEAPNLAKFLSLQPKRLPEAELVKIVTQVAEALDYAHSKQKGASGIKLNNILIGKENHVYLSDYGLMRVVGTGAVLSRTYKSVIDFLSVKPGYTSNGPEKYAAIKGDLSAVHLSFLQNYAFLAPEQKTPVAGKPADAKSDMYAFGVLVYYLIFRSFPEGFFELPSTAAPEYKLNWDQLLYRCLQSDPAKRPVTLKSALEELGKQISSAGRFSVAPKPPEDLPKPVLKPQELVKPEFEPDPGAIFQTETTIGRYQPQEQLEASVEPLLTDMAVVRGGTFLRGCNSGSRDEMPRHSITLDPFAIDIHPVTNEQFVRFLEAMGGEKDSNNNDIIRLRESRIKRSGGKLNVESGYAKHPVVGITWYGAVAYAKWIGKRLPTEAEWEVACYGGENQAIYPTGDDIERVQANFFSSDTTAVMSYPPNPFGLYDLAGNVYEWCQDWYGYHYYDVSVQEPTNPKGPLQGVYRILRGGCWKSLKEDLRCAHRHRNNPGTVNGTYGFRCAADVS